MRWIWRLVEDRQQRAVQLLRGREVAAERLLHDDPRPRIPGGRLHQAGLPEAGPDAAERFRRRRQVVHDVALRAVPCGDLLERLAQRFELLAAIEGAATVVRGALADARAARNRSAARRTPAPPRPGARAWSRRRGAWSRGRAWRSARRGIRAWRGCRATAGACAARDRRCRRRARACRGEPGWTRCSRRAEQSRLRSLTPRSGQGNPARRRPVSAPGRSARSARSRRATRRASGPDRSAGTDDGGAGARPAPHRRPRPKPRAPPRDVA